MCIKYTSLLLTLFTWGRMLTSYMSQFVFMSRRVIYIMLHIFVTFNFFILRMFLQNSEFMCLKCIITCLYQFVFRFGQFIDLKLTYLLNYWRFLWFWPLQRTLFSSYFGILLSLGLNKKFLDIMQCLKYIIKCLYQFVFKFYQFLDFKLTYRNASNKPPPSIRPPSNK